jgi:hypothetical protein
LSSLGRRFRLYSQSFAPQGTVAMPRIFLSYRREDSEHIAGRLYDRLKARFGRGNVFMDLDTIPFGVDFREHLGQAVARCDVLLAVIGEAWLDVRFENGPRQGQRRLDDPADFVRIEVESALARNIPVIPVLVGKAAMPAEQELPQGTLRALAFRNAAEVRSGRDFHDHVSRLIRGIEHLGSGQKEQSKAPVNPPSSQDSKIGDTISNTLSMRFAWVPPGKSWLGGGDKPGTQEFTLPKGLWCGVYPVI